MSKPATTPISQTPAVIMVYGGPGTGKTTDILYSLPRSFFFARPAALKSSNKVVGWEPSASQVWYTPRIKEMTEYVPKLGKDFDSVVADDFSVQSEETYDAVKRGYKGSNSYAPWTLLRTEVLDFVRVARDCGKHVIINCHEAPPKTKNGHTLKGGPRLPTDLQEMVPALTDTVLRAYPAPGRSGPWKVAYRCTEYADPGFYSKDRHGVTPDMAPMNLGEILRLAGFKLRRAPGLEWIDDVAEKICGHILQTQNAQQEQEVMKQAIAWLQQGVTQNLLHIRWALRDGMDRAILRRAQANILSTFFEAASPGLVTL